MTPQELIIAYLAEIARLYGAEVAHETVLVYEHVWFYLNIARRYSDGSVGAWPIGTSYRRTKLEAMLETLRGRISGA